MDKSASDRSQWAQIAVALQATCASLLPVHDELPLPTRRLSDVGGTIAPDFRALFRSKKQIRQGTRGRTPGDSGKLRKSKAQQTRRQQSTRASARGRVGLEVCTLESFGSYVVSVATETQRHRDNRIN